MKIRVHTVLDRDRQISRRVIRDVEYRIRHRGLGSGAACAAVASKRRLPAEWVDSIWEEHAEPGHELYGR
jgi:hypothetical protein